MKDCRKCGEPLLEGTNFCSNCGDPTVSGQQAITIVRNVAPPGIAGQGPFRLQRRLHVGKTVALVLLALFAVIGYIVYRNHLASERFANNIRCAGIAREFASSQSGGPRQVEVFESIYSTRRGSCAAVVERKFFGSSRFIVEVADPVTGEVMWTNGCAVDEECSMSAEIFARRQAGSFLDTLADKALERH